MPSVLRKRRVELLAAVATLAIILVFFLFSRTVEGVEIDLVPCDPPIQVGQICARIHVPAGQFVSSLELEVGGSANFIIPIPLEPGPFVLTGQPGVFGVLTGDLTFPSGVSGYGYGYDFGYGYGYGAFAGYGYGYGYGYGLGDGFGYGYGYGYGFPSGGDIFVNIKYTPAPGTYTLTFRATSNVDGQQVTSESPLATLTVPPPTPSGDGGGVGGVVPTPTATPTATPTVVPVEPEDGIVVVVLPDQQTTVTFGGVTFDIPAGAHSERFQVRLRVLDAASLTDEPDGEVLAALEIELFDAEGNPLEDVTFSSPATLTIALTDAEVEAFGGLDELTSAADAGRLLIQRLEPNGWIILVTTADISSQSFSVLLSDFSTFALVATEAEATPTPTPTQVPTATGTPTEVPPPPPTATPVSPTPTATATVAPPPATATPPAPVAAAPPPPAPAAPAPVPTVAAPPPPPPVAAPAPPTPQPTAVAPAPPAEEEDGGVPFWVWLIIGLGVLAVAGGGAWGYLRYQERAQA